MVDALVISPATTIRPVVSRVSQATRDSGSPARAASRTASEIWSAILSGCPSVTDSDVKRKLSIAPSVSVVQRPAGSIAVRPSLRPCLVGELAKRLDPILPTAASIVKRCLTRVQPVATPAADVIRSPGARGRHQQASEDGGGRGARAA